MTVAKPWFRLYHEFVSDAKVQILAFEDQRHYVALLCLKCNGTLDASYPSPAYRDRVIAKALGLALDSALEARRRLQEGGLIDDSWQPEKWDERQYESDTSTARTRAWRERNGSKRHCDVTVTDKSRAEQRQSRAEGETRAGADEALPDVPRPDVPRETGTSHAAAVLQTALEEWRSVPGVSPEAMQTWIRYSETQLQPPKLIAPLSRIALAKTLAGMGAAETQMAAVEHCIGNGFRNLRPSDGGTAAGGQRRPNSTADRLKWHPDQDNAHG